MNYHEAILGKTLGQATIQKVERALRVSSRIVSSSLLFFAGGFYKIITWEIFSNFEDWTAQIGR